eukprot:PhF_6_TR10576/c0_g1_i2/m.16863/K14802/DRS2, ATP8A; phospholipid-transporting ATPase
MLALCNTVVISGGEKGTPVRYEGASTDEVALVDTAAANKFRLVSRTSDTITVDILGDKFDYKILAVLPFTPERKMMTIVLMEKDNSIVQYTKGADSSIMENINMDISRNQQLVASCKVALDGFAEEGLRTLAFGQRTLSLAEFEDWKHKWDEALVSMNDRELAVHNACLMLEKDLDFVAVSAIEDRLQDEVPETIKYFLDAKVVVWILTGDKRETAITISVTSQLMDRNNDDLIILDVTLPTSVAKQITEAQDRTFRNRQKLKKTTMVIDGKTLEEAMKPEVFHSFRDLGTQVSSAVCCRVTPLQKANVVAMFQALGNTCVGVGDGANDVSMIQEARVGVGILGLEGSQAERASDYAIPKFRFLRRLLCVHGRSSLVRNSMLIQYSFYKNIVYTMCQFFYAFYNGFSGQTVFDSWAIVCFNMIFTVLPPLVMGMFDFDLRDHVIMKHPILYHELRDPFAVRMSRVTSSLWAGLSVVHGVIVFGVFAQLSHDDGVLPDGQTAGMWALGTTLMTFLIVVVLMQAGLAFLSWTSIHVLSIVLSVVGYLVFLFAYTEAGPFFKLLEFVGIPYIILKDPKLYLYITVYTVGLFAIELSVMAYRANYFATQSHQARAVYSIRGRGLPWMRYKDTLANQSLINQQMMTSTTVELQRPQEATAALEKDK